MAAAPGHTKSAIASHFDVNHWIVRDAVNNAYKPPDNEESDDEHISLRDRERYARVRDLHDYIICPSSKLIQTSR